MSRSARPRQRQWSERPKGPRDRPPLDSRLRLWLPPLIGGGVGLVWVIWTGMSAWVIPLMAALAIVVNAAITGGAAWLMGEAAFGTSGNTTPYKADYSRADALAKRGDFDQAINAYDAAITESPEDPEPYLRIARILHKDLGKLDDAAYWYRRARRDADLSAGRDLAVSREIIELYLASDDRDRAIPELARIVDKFVDTPEREWAEGLLAQLRRRDEGN